MEKILSILENLSNTKWLNNNAEISGDLILTEGMLNLIHDLDELNLIHTNIKVEDKTLTLSSLSLENHKSNKISIQLQPPREMGAKGFFAKDINDLLSIKKFQVEESNHYYIASENYYSISSEPNKKVKKYLSIVKTISTIKNIADHTDNRGGNTKLIFLARNKIVIPIKYKFELLKEIDSVNEMSLLLETEPHLENKIEIFKSTLYNSLRNVPENERFTHLVNCYETVFSSFKDNYNLFISEFSFDKLKEEVEKRKIEYTNMLNQIFSDIQNKILAIPVALLLVSTQMENDELNILKNFIILVSSLIFFILIHFLIRNQFNTLNTIKESIDSIKEEYEEKYASLFSKFKNIFNGLESRYNYQRFVLVFIWFLALASFFLSIGIFIYYHYCFFINYLK